LYCAHLGLLALPRAQLHLRNPDDGTLPGPFKFEKYGDTIVIEKKVTEKGQSTCTLKSMRGLGARELKSTPGGRPVNGSLAGPKRSKVDLRELHHIKEHFNIQVREQRACGGPGTKHRARLSPVSNITCGNPGTKHRARLSSPE